MEGYSLLILESHKLVILTLILAYRKTLQVIAIPQAGMMGMGMVRMLQEL
jgi:hypothetical protein